MVRPTTGSSRTLAVVRGTIGNDPDLAAQWDLNEDQRHTAYRALGDLLADRNALRAGLSANDASDLAFLLASADNYLVATGVLGWTPQRWQHTTAMLVTRALLGDSPV